MKKNLVFLAMTTIIVACTTVVDFDIPLNKPKVVVNSLFSPDSVWQIQISRTNSVLSDMSGSYFQPVADALVTIFDQNNQLVESIPGFSNQGLIYASTYKGKTMPMPGQAYTIQIAINNEPAIQAVNKVPMKIPIISLEVDSIGFKVNRDPIELDVSFKDPPEEKNYYTFRITQDAYYIANSDTVRFIQEVYFDINRTSLSNESNGSDQFLNDNLFNGKDYTARLKLYPRFNNPPQQSSNTRFFLLNVSEEYHKYFTTKNLQDITSGDPFAQPVQVFTNIENGLGIFAGYSLTSVELN